MAEATMRHGDPIMADYTPGAGAVTAGEIVLLGNTTGLTNGVAHQDIANSTLGALAVGGGIYDIVVADSYAAWTPLYWDDANGTMVDTNSFSFFGFSLGAAAAANATVEVLHRPYV